MALRFQAEFQARCVAPFQAELPQQILSGLRDRAGLHEQCQPSSIMREFLTVREGPKKQPIGFRRIPPDDSHSLRFVMGSMERDSEGPHQVVILEAFLVACSPTTNEQYELFDPSHRQRAAWDEGLDIAPREDTSDRCPVVWVSFYDAWTYCLWLGEGYRLPSEEEWEFACRARSKTRWFFGDDKERLREYAWYSANSDRVTHPVGELKANEWGLYDVHGNVREWCDTRWSVRGSTRVLRGGSWDDTAGYVRSAARDDGRPDYRCSRFGFRVARILTEHPFPLFPSSRT
ncbi:MAG: formylglycine-generating enzyme family protein [Planctomycetota bacterium]|nr:formylglycine-generating enzyme family protein [Planctomycetota bacterium]